jgi:hypothetical protein
MAEIARPSAWASERPSSHDLTSADGDGPRDSTGGESAGRNPSAWSSSAFPAAGSPGRTASSRVRDGRRRRLRRHGRHSCGGIVRARRGFPGSWRRPESGRASVCCRGRAVVLRKPPRPVPVADLFISATAGYRWLHRSGFFADLGLGAAWLRTRYNGFGSPTPPQCGSSATESYSCQTTRVIPDVNVAVGIEF